MKLVNRLIRWGLKPTTRKMLRYMDNPADVQQDWLRRLLSKAAQTTWGKKYDYKSISKIETFQQRVPISNYDDLKPFIHQMMMGQADVLWPGITRWYSKSSGTTSDKSKFIPVSMENLHKCHIKGGHDTMALWFYENPSSEIFANSKGIVMGGNHQSFAEHPNTQIGDVSAVMIKNMPFYAKYLLTPDLKTALMSDWETKIERIAEQATQENVTNLSGVPTWSIVLFQKILERTGKKHLLEVFPNFELYLHGGVSFRPYREQFQQFFPSERVSYREIYNASEGFFAAQRCQGEEDMLLFLDNATFYEFVPLDQLQEDQPKAYSIEEVELGRNYAMLISTNAGLWRYLIGDTVKFTSLYPHKIQITGRTKHFINAFGEEVIVENTDRALELTCRQTGAQVREYTVAPIPLSARGKGGHEWLLEFDRPPQNLTEFSSLLDQNLQQINSDYEAKRYKSIALQELTLHHIPKGSFHFWLKQKGKFGGQNKVPRLSNSRKYVEEILEIAGHLS